MDEYKYAINKREWILYLLLYIGYLKNMFFGIEKIISIFQYMVLFIAFLYTIRDLKIGMKKQAWITVLVIIFIMYCILSRAWSPSTVYSTEKERELIISLLYIIPFAFLGKKFNIDKYANIIVYSNSFFIILYFIKNISSIISSTGINLRLGSFLNDNPIWVGRFCCETLLVMFFIDIKGKNKLNAIRIIHYLFVLTVSLLTGSKGPLVGMIIGAIFLIVFVFNGITAEMKRYAIRAGMAIICGMIIIYGIFNEKINALLRINTTLVAVKGYRSDMYNTTIDSLGVLPINGHGLGSWSLFYWGQDIASYPHNMFLEIWYECGIIGIVLIMLVIVSVIKGVREYKSISYGFLSALFVYSLSCAMFSGSISSGNRGVYLYAILCGVFIINTDYTRLGDHL